MCVGAKRGGGRAVERVEVGAEDAGGSRRRGGRARRGRAGASISRRRSGRARRRSRRLDARGRAPGARRSRAGARRGRCGRRRAARSRGSLEAPGGSRRGGALERVPGGQLGQDDARPRRATASAIERRRPGRAGREAAGRGRSSRRRRSIDGDDEAREDRARARAPPTAPKASRTSERSAQLAAKRRGRDALGLEVEELSALVAGVADQRHPEADGREQERRSAPAAVSVRVIPRASGSEASCALDVRPRRRARARRRAGGASSLLDPAGDRVGAESQSSSGVAVPGASASRAVARRLSSTTTKPWPESSRGREPARDPDDPRRQLASWKLSVIVPRPGRRPRCSGSRATASGRRR